MAQGQVANLTLHFTTCGVDLGLALDRTLALRIAVIFVTLWMVAEHLVRPLWRKWAKTELPVDRYLSLTHYPSDVSYIINFLKDLQKLEKVD